MGRGQPDKVVPFCFVEHLASLYLQRPPGEWSLRPPVLNSLVVVWGCWDAGYRGGGAEGGLTGYAGGAGARPHGGGGERGPVVGRLRPLHGLLVVHVQLLAVLHAHTDTHTHTGVCTHTHTHTHRHTHTHK